MLGLNNKEDAMEIKCKEHEMKYLTKRIINLADKIEVNGKVIKDRYGRTRG